MAVWEITFDSDTFQHLEVPSSENLAWMDTFIGDSLVNVWQPITVSISWDRNKIQGDFPSIGGAPPVFNERALHFLQPLIQNDIEALPLICPTEKLYAINIIKVLDCLDKEKSQIKYLSSGRVMRIERYVFKEGCLADSNIFKIPEQIKNRHYVSDAFKSMVEMKNLKGMVFKQIA